jgi:predicted metal-dependent phosphoesterase TrpH
MNSTYQVTAVVSCMLKLDLHLHSCFSDDALGSPADIVKSLKKRGLQGMALTDHNTLKGYLQIRKNIPKDFLVIPGMEISTTDGHLLAFNIVEEIHPGGSIEETVERVIDGGGIPVVPHLFRLLSGIKKEKLKGIQTKVSAIEVFNGCSVPTTNLKTAKVAHEFHLGGTGGSDSHDPIYAGYAYTIVDTTDLRIDTVLSEIQKKKTWGEGRTIPLTYRRDRMVLSIRQYVQRGFKRV